MRVTVCELPHEAAAFEAAWSALREHTAAHASELVVLPELAGAAPVWARERFDAREWSEAEAAGDALVRRLPELRARRVVGARPVRVGERRFIQGFLWSAEDGVRALRSKAFLPQEPGTWEASWFDPGEPVFPLFRAGDASFGLNVCTELWALETFAAYAELGARLVLTPRATEAATLPRWLALGTVAAMRSGAFSLSSNRVDPTGACGGGSWIVDPSGRLLALTSAAEPFATRDVDLASAATPNYPRYALGSGLSFLATDRIRRSERTDRPRDLQLSEKRET